MRPVQISIFVKELEAGNFSVLEANLWKLQKRLKALLKLLSVTEDPCNFMHLIIVSYLCLRAK